MTTDETLSVESLEQSVTVNDVGVHPGAAPAGSTLDQPFGEEQASSGVMESNALGNLMGEQPPPPGDGNREKHSDQACLKKHMEYINESLRDKEILKIRRINKDIKESYYKLWSSDANKYFRIAVILRRRLSHWEGKTENVS